MNITNPQSQFETKSLKGIAVGDSVFVVDQNNRYQKDQPRNTHHEIVTKVGRKYGYFMSGHFEQKFHLDSGMSFEHPDSNSRINGRGFDVFVSEQEYLKLEYQSSEFFRLEDRLITSRMSGLKDLSPTAVEEIHKILDQEPEN